MIKTTANHDISAAMDYSPSKQRRVPLKIIGQHRKTIV